MASRAAPASCAAGSARAIDLRFTPELHFQPDVSYDEARHIDELLASPEVARDLNAATRTRRA